MIKNVEKEQKLTSKSIYKMCRRDKTKNWQKKNPVGKYMSKICVLAQYWGHLAATLSHYQK